VTKLQSDKGVDEPTRIHTKLYVNPTNTHKFTPPTKKKKDGSKDVLAEAGTDACVIDVTKEKDIGAVTKGKDTVNKEKDIGAIGVNRHMDMLTKDTDNGGSSARALKKMAVIRRARTRPIPVGAGAGAVGGGGGEEGLAVAATARPPLASRLFAWWPFGRRCLCVCECVCV
jgi:hypothetical protein